MPTINKTVLMSGTDFFSVGAAINPFMHSDDHIDREKAQAEHAAIKDALQDAGVKVVTVPPPTDCQDGVYAANWGLVRGDKAVLASLPGPRKAEEAYAEQVLTDLGKTVHRLPEGIRFSGQGDALPCGEWLFAGSRYRTDPAAHDFVAQTLGYQVIALQAAPLKNWLSSPRTNKTSGWPDSFFYDIDLAISVLRAPVCSRLDLAQSCARSNLEHQNCTPGLIAWCPAAFLPESRDKLRAFDAVDKIEVSLAEAKTGFACNLVSTGETVVMSSRAPRLRAEIEQYGLSVITPEITELAKGGGFIRCTSLTLD